MNLVKSVSLAFASLLLMSSTLSAETKRPNIVFLLSDDQPLRAMGHIDPWFSTPNMDQLANEGVVFNNAFVESAVCCVSRASFMMGQYSARHKVRSFDTPLSREQMAQSFPVLLRNAGYRTALLGKYAVGHKRAAPEELCLPADQFDLFYAFQQSPSYVQDVDGKKTYLTTAMEDKAIRFMKETPKDQPFMVYMCLPEPHGQGGPGGPWNYRDPEFELAPPTTPPVEPKTMTKEAYNRLPLAIRKSSNSNAMGGYQQRYPKYMATVRDYIARTDLAIGRMRQALKEIGRDENTIIIFTSDHGTMWGAHGIAGKWNMYEESIRIPMMIFDPRNKKATSGSRDPMVLNIDVTATILDLAGVPEPESMQGQSLLPLINDPDAKGRDAWYYNHNVHTRSKAKLPKCEGVRTERWKYIHYIDTDPVEEELFDLHADPIEQNNLVGNPEYADVLTMLRNRNEELRESAQ
jgi:arylsulfatase A-like enzyme